jgi:hypothetical protein
MSNMVKFNTPAGSPDIVYIFLDRIHTCQNKWTAELMKNLSDFVLSNILDKGFNVIQGLDEDLLLREAAKDYTHAVVLSTGTEFINGDEFFHEVEKEVYSGKDFFLIGHIPDRDDGYYELHDQCYIINLETYKELGEPIVGEFAYYSEHTQHEPRRSSENIHDDYTPIWVTGGDVPRTYKHKWHGWNILSVAFENNKHVKVIMDRFRNNKIYYYPNYEPAFIPKSSYLYGKYSVASQALFYPYNTEEFVAVDFKGPVRQLIIQASGLQWYEYLLYYGYDENTVVRFVDYNLFALECMFQITLDWDGKQDYMEFVQNYVDSRKDFLSTGGDHWITMTGGKQTVDTKMWIDMICKVRFEFYHEDLVLNTALPVSKWVDNAPGTIIHLSHIFNYDPVATFVPLKHRIYNERSLLDKLKKYVPDATLIMVGSVSDTVTRPTWHMNGDWCGL